MLFNSVVFLCLLAPTLALYWATRVRAVRLLVLLVASLVFYAWYHWPSVFLLAGTILANYALGRWQERARSRRLLAASIALNLSVLLWFKYAAFLAGEAVRVAAALGLELPTPSLDRWLPLGISFFTFQVVAYQIDVYKGELAAERDLLVFAVFKSFFAQLIAGPIVRGKEMLPQLREVQPFHAARAQRGVFLVVAGLALKLAVADVLAQFAVDAFDQTPAIIATRASSEAWLGLYAYALQLFADFWGYSTVAVGLGLLFGFTLPVNFRLPYLAASLQDFWRRWHITLSAWFRDYLYVPLGGNRRRSGANLVVTMALAGVWHGAGWNFLGWGAAHGAWLWLERRLGWQTPARTRVGRGLRVLAVFHGVCLLWVLFRARSLAQASAYYGRLLLPPYTANPRTPELLVGWLVGFSILAPLLARWVLDDETSARPLWRQVALTCVLILLMLAYGGATYDFIYFQF